MRIDYSEPKQSFVTSHGKPRPRKEPVGMIATLVIAGVVIGFVGGFGTGWFFSQKSAKKSFQAAIEQKSLENSPKPPEAAPAPPPVKPQPAPADGSQQIPQPTTPGATQAAPGSPPPAEPALSFYKTLPSGQINNVLGSGINSKDDKAKQPLQAAIPTNVIRQQQQPAAGTVKPAGKPAVSSSNAKPAPEKAPAADKPPARVVEGGFTVQVASYSLKSEAETLKKSLANKGYNVIITESNLGDKGTWYRVRIGRRLEQESARDLAGKLGRGAIVIPDRE